MDSERTGPLLNDPYAEQSYPPIHPQNQGV